MANPERMARINSELLTLADRTLFHTAVESTNKQLTVRDQVVRVTNSYAIEVILPSVAEAVGLTFTISVTSATAAITVTDFGGSSYNDSVNWEGDFTLDAAEDTVTLQSDGRTWHVLEEEVA